MYKRQLETHASVLQADLSWTEKVCGMACARDGSLSVNFGFGKYPNRNVVDGYGGASRGVEQWTVRASRALASDPDRIDVGPLRYEVLEPLRAVRVVLEPNAVQPLAYDMVLRGSLPCTLEEREDRRTLTGYRRSADQIRYHQLGVASGWVQLEGRRIEVTPESWLMTRDHSWGLRPAVGVPATDPVSYTHLDVYKRQGLHVGDRLSPLHAARAPAGRAAGPRTRLA